MWPNTVDAKLQRAALAHQQQQQMDSASADNADKSRSTCVSAVRASADLHCTEAMSRRPGSTSGTMTLAASFFVKATEKLNKSAKTGAEQPSKSKKQKSKQTVGVMQRSFAQRDVERLFEPVNASPRQNAAQCTRFSEVLRLHAPPLPALNMACSQKVKVLLRIVDGPNSPQQASTAACLADLGSFNQQPPLLTVDAKHTYVTVHENVLDNEYVAPSQRKQVPPKVFPFDSIFTKDDPLPNLCATALGEIVDAVVNGVDGCVVCYGSAKLGKASTLVGQDTNSESLGMIPCAIAWLFQLINSFKEKSNARFSVRVSALEISGKNETVRDLLSEVAESTDAVSCTAPTAYLRPRLDANGACEAEQSELRAPSAERAAFYLDKALQARTKRSDDDASRMDHFIFTLHVYQCRVEKQEVSGGHSKLHLIDLGLGCRSRDAPCAMTSAAISNVMLGLLNGQRHIAHRESRLTQFLRDSLSLTCLCTVIAHASAQIQHYSESMNALQFAQRLLRLQRRRNKVHKANSDESTSSYDSFGVRRAGRCRPRGLMMGTSGLMRPRLTSSALSHSEPDGACTSSSEQSCDTVIYLGSGAQYHVTETDTDADANTNTNTNTNALLHSRPQRSEMKRSRSTSSGHRSKRHSSSRMSTSDHWLTEQPSEDFSSLSSGQCVLGPTSHSLVGTDSHFYGGVALEEVWIDGPREFRCAQPEQTQTALVPTNALLDTCNSVPMPAQLQFAPVATYEPSLSLAASASVSASPQMQMQMQNTGDDRYERNSCASSCVDGLEDVDVRGGRALSDISEHTEKTQPVDADQSESSIPDLPVVFPEMLSNLLKSENNSDRRSDEQEQEPVLPNETTKPQDLVSSWIEQHMDPDEMAESLCSKLDQLCKLRETAIASTRTTPLHERPCNDESHVPPTPPPLAPLLTPRARERRVEQTCGNAGPLKVRHLNLGAPGDALRTNDQSAEEDLDAGLLDLAAQPPNLSAAAFQQPGLKNLERVALWLQTLSTTPPSQGISPSNSIAQSSTRSATADSQSQSQSQQHMTLSNNMPTASTPSLPTPTSEALKSAVPPRMVEAMEAGGNSRMASNVPNCPSPVTPSPAMQHTSVHGTLPDAASQAQSQSSRQHTRTSSCTVAPRHAQSTSVQMLATPSGLYLPDCAVPHAHTRHMVSSQGGSQVGQHALMVASMHSHASLPFAYAPNELACRRPTRDADVQTQPVADVVCLSRLANPSIVSPGCVSPCYSATAKSACASKSPKSAKSLLKCMLFPRHSCNQNQAQKGAKSGSIFCVRRSGSVEDANASRYRLGDAVCSDHSSSSVLSDSGSASRRAFESKLKTKGFFAKPFAQKSKEPHAQVRGESASDVTPTARTAMSGMHLHQGASPAPSVVQEHPRTATCSPMYQSAWHAGLVPAVTATAFFPQTAFINARMMHAAGRNQNHTLSTFALSSGHMSDSSACGVPPVPVPAPAPAPASASAFKARMDGYTFLPRGYGAGVGVGVGVAGASTRLRYRRIPYVHNAFGRSTTAGTSSGYESMIRDSEATSSSHNDSTSESSVADGMSPTDPRYKVKTHTALTNSGITRSSSVPPQKMMGYSLGLLNASHNAHRSPQIVAAVPQPQDVTWNVVASTPIVGGSVNESSVTQNLQAKHVQSDVEAVRPTQLAVAPQQHPQFMVFHASAASVEQRSFTGSIVDGHLLQYESDDVERMQRRRRQQITREISEKQRLLEIRSLLQKQSLLKRELSEAKKRLQVDPACWSYDLHVAEETDPRDPGFLEALRKETEILEKRVKACKSHVMLITCFDSCTS